MQYMDLQKTEDEKVRELKRILLQAWAPERLPELDEPAPWTNGTCIPPLFNSVEEEEEEDVEDFDEYLDAEDGDEDETQEDTQDEALQDGLDFPIDSVAGEAHEPEEEPLQQPEQVALASSHQPVQQPEQVALASSRQPVQPEQVALASSNQPVQQPEQEALASSDQPVQQPEQEALASSDQPVQQPEQVASASRHAQAEEPGVVVVDPACKHVAVDVHQAGMTSKQMNQISKPACLQKRKPISATHTLEDDDDDKDAIQKPARKVLKAWPKDTVDPKVDEDRARKIQEAKDRLNYLKILVLITDFYT